MQIAQQSEKKLVLREDTKILGLLVLVVGFFTSWIIIYFTYNLSIHNESIRAVAVVIAAILLIFVLVYFYSVYKTIVITFDKDSDKFIVSTTTLFPKRQLIYSLKDITQIINKPITIYNGAWGIRGIIWNKMYGDQIPTDGIFNAIVITIKDNKEYVLKPNAWTLFFTNKNNVNADKEVTAEKIANFLDVPFSQEELAKSHVKS